MQHIPVDDVLQISLSLYKAIGERMIDRTSKILHLYRAFNIIVMIFILAGIIANLFHVEGGMYISTIEGSLTVIHVGTYIRNVFNTFRSGSISFRPY